jgi:hypothetical protein
MLATPVAAQAPAPTTTAFDGTYVGVSRTNAAAIEDRLGRASGAKVRISPAICSGTPELRVPARGLGLDIPEEFVYFRIPKLLFTV